MLSEITSAVVSLNAAKELLKTALEVVKDSAARNAIIELQVTLLSVNNSLLQTQIEHQALVDVKKELEKKLLDCENWNADAPNYELIEVSFGVRVYCDKSETQDVYKRIWFCPTCFENKKKKILQLQSRKSPMEYVCNHCNSTFRVRPLKDT